MTTAARVRYLIERHGDTIRAAAMRIGCPKSTLADLVNGAEAHLEERVKAVAAAYGVDPNGLVPGRDPKADFEWSVRCATDRERFEFAMMTIQERTRLTMEFLAKGYQGRFGDKQLAALSGLSPKTLAVVKSQWDYVPPDLCTTRSLVNGIYEFSDVELPWFDCGFLGDENGLRVLSGYVSAAAMPALRVGNSKVAPVVGQTVKLALERTLAPGAA